MNIACLMDPIENINPDKDTSYAILKQAESMGHSLFYVPKNGLSLISSPIQKVLFQASKITTQTKSKHAFKRIETSKNYEEKDIDICLIRTDPPFDEAYLHNTWILDQCQHTIVLNHPTGIRSVNEKIWATQFHNLMPKTLISSNIKQCKAFIKDNKKAVIKPTDGFGGQSIFIITDTDQNINALLETVSQNETKAIICQEYIPEASVGDKRILLLNGEPLGAILRKHSADDPRNNFFAGGTALKSEITSIDLKIIEAIKPFLLKENLFFVGIDIIGEKLIEINVTSPTCLQEMSALNNKNLAQKIVSSLEQLSKN